MPDTQFHSVLELPSQHGVVPLRQRANYGICTRLSRGLGNLFAIGRQRHVADPDVLARREVVAGIILKHDRQIRTQLIELEFAEVDAIDPHGSASGIVEPAQELDERRLAGTILSHQRYVFTGVNGETHILQYIHGGAGILEADPVELNATPHRTRKSLRTWRIHDSRLELQEPLEVREKEIVLVQTRQPSQHVAKEVLRPLECTEIHNHIAHRYRPGERSLSDDEHRAEHRHDCYRLCQKLEQRSPRRQAQPLAPDLLAQRPMATPEKVAQAEQPNLFRRLDRR